MKFVSEILPVILGLCLACMFVIGGRDTTLGDLGVSAHAQINPPTDSDCPPLILTAAQWGNFKSRFWNTVMHLYRAFKTISGKQGATDTSQPNKVEVT